jgi:hypothetical protein
MATVKVFQVKFPDSPLVVRAESGKGPAVAAMVESVTQFIRENIKLVEVDEVTGAPADAELAERIADDAAAAAATGDEDERRQGPSPDRARIQINRR